MIQKIKCLLGYHTYRFVMDDKMKYRKKTMEFVSECYHCKDKKITKIRI